MRRIALGLFFAALASCAERLPTVDTTTLTEGAPSQASVYIEVRDAATDIAVRTRVTGAQDIPVTGSSWSCKYKKPIDAQSMSKDPTGATFAMRVHSIECAVGGAGAGVSITCPVTSSDVTRETAAKHLTRMMTTLALSENAGAKRTAVAIVCEP